MDKKMGRPMSENPKIYRIGVRLTEEEYQKLNKYCIQRGLTKTEFIRICIQYYITKEVF